MNMKLFFAGISCSEWIRRTDERDRRPSSCRRGNAEDQHDHRRHHHSGVRHQGRHANHRDQLRRGQGHASTGQTYSTGQDLTRSGIKALSVYSSLVYLSILLMKICTPVTMFAQNVFIEK